MDSEIKYIDLQKQTAKQTLSAMILCIPTMLGPSLVIPKHPDFLFLSAFAFRGKKLIWSPLP